MLIISGCGTEPYLEPKDCPPKPCEKQPCIFSKLPTYKTPPSNKLTPPVDLGNGMYAVVGIELKETLSNIAKLRKICANYAYVSKITNEEYQQKDIRQIMDEK